MKKAIKWTIGVDEAGRGPLAGPVSVSAVLVPHDFDWEQLPGVNDSKKLTEKKREVVFELAKKMYKEGKLVYAVEMVLAKEIDKKGIVPAIKLAMDRSLSLLENYHTINRMIRNFHSEVYVTLDGSLVAPERFVYQETIIKGDAQEKVIGLASIMAKVTRDRYMVRRSSESAFSPYNFATHKGYGTKAHREAIAKYGLSPEHRISYCKNIDLL